MALCFLPDEHHPATKADRVAIHHVWDDRLIAFVEVVSQSNKDCRHSTDQFLTKLLDAFYLVLCPVNP